MVRMAAFYLIRGTNINVFRGATSVHGRIFNGIIKTYLLQTGRQPTDILTLARVCKTFPWATVTVAIKAKDRLPVPHSRMQEMVPGYPAAMMTTVFAELIPQGEPYTATIRDAHYLYIAELIKFVDLKMRPKPNWEVVDNFKGRASALERCFPAPKARRVEYMQKWGILVGGVCSEAVTNAAELFRRDYGLPNPASGTNPPVPKTK
ncbi:uncharacterized protein LOC125759337 isoform X2 [Rhipicephalus sanguineus]|uniref:uncharacterized protein LOC125759337 isoform X2 n=1 Tax=Rhipicephalus sanguineus TaxID=34632 RepID=UPI0020C467C1|nr:uncharacterized protein LOC125759337 isoform X2 [Rhipicephalus sanguineus]